MAKILLVEDDNNLREIYEARLQAEGYVIVSAKDGEEALVLAKSEHPDLIISDVMMPRVSGFEMLDILRNTNGLKDTKIIMLTALGQAEDKTRADSLGADRYLVKSQVTLEDIVKTAQELLGQDGTAAGSVTATVSATPPPAPNITATPVVPATPAPSTPTASPQVAPVAVTPPAAAPPESVAPPASATTPVVPAIAPIPIATPPVAATPPPVISMPPAAAASMPKPALAIPPEPTPFAPAPGSSTTVATPPTSTSAESTTPPIVSSVAPTLTQPSSTEEAAVQAQINTFVNQPIPGTPPSDSGANPTTLPPTPQPDTNATDQLVADAVKNLTPPETPKPAAAAPAAPTPPAPITPQPADPENDAGAVAHKKVIAPISDPTVSARPDLNELLAREGINNLDELPHQPVVPSTPGDQPGPPHPPGHVITPTKQPTPGGIDPNSIAL